jgi:hypothetical protein
MSDVVASHQPDRRLLEDRASEVRNRLTASVVVLQIDPVETACL